MLLGACKPYRKIGATNPAPTKINKMRQAGNDIIDLLKKPEYKELDPTGFIKDSIVSFLKSYLEIKNSIPHKSLEEINIFGDSVENDLRVIKSKVNEPLFYAAIILDKNYAMPSVAKKVLTGLTKFKPNTYKKKDTNTAKKDTVVIAPKKTNETKKAQSNFKTIDVRAYTVPKHKRRIKLR
jgi:hypothetical protein